MVFYSFRFKLSVKSLFVSQYRAIGNLNDKLLINVVYILQNYPGYVLFLIRFNLKEMVTLTMGHMR